MACGPSCGSASTDYPRDVRWYSADVDSDDPSPTINVGEIHPQCRGWDVSITTVLGDGAVIIGQLALRDPELRAVVERTVGNLAGGTGVLLSRGGRVYVPSPTFVLKLADMMSSGNTSRVFLTARPVYPGDSPIGEPVCYGFKPQNVATQTAVSWPVPPGATGYRVAFEESSQPYKVSEHGGEVECGSYSIDPTKPVDAGAAQGIYRQTPPVEETAAERKIVVANSDDTNARLVTVFWKFDLRTLE